MNNYNISDKDRTLYEEYFAQYTSNVTKICEELDKKRLLSDNPSYDGIHSFVIHFSTSLLEDLNQISGLYYSIKSVNYARIIYRTTIEHIILFAYILSQPQLIEEYYGGNINISNVIRAEEEEKNLIKALKYLTEKRKKKLGISEMSKILDDGTDIYNIYKQLCDYSHDNYYVSFLKNELSIENQKEDIYMFLEKLKFGIEVFRTLLREFNESH